MKADAAGRDRMSIQNKVSRTGLIEAFLLPWRENMRQHKIGLPFVIVVSALLPLCAAIVVAEDRRSPDRDKRDVLALEDRWLASEDDPDALKTILADDFIHALPIGFATKNEQLSYVARVRGQSPQHGERHFEDMHVRIYGDVGIVNAIVVESPGNGTQKTVFTDVFVRRQGQWQAVNAQELPFRQSISQQP